VRKWTWRACAPSASPCNLGAECDPTRWQSCANAVKLRNLVVACARTFRWAPTHCVGVGVACVWAVSGRPSQPYHYYSTHHGHGRRGLESASQLRPNSGGAHRSALAKISQGGPSFHPTRATHRGLHHRQDDLEGRHARVRRRLLR
jgi:hypothetical protein